MANKQYRDLDQLRRHVTQLIQSGRYRFTHHAETEHPEIAPEDKRAVVLWGSQDRPNERAPPGRASYVCWYRHPRLGLLRAIYAIVEPPVGGQVVIITVFRE